MKDGSCRNQYYFGYSEKKAHESLVNASVIRPTNEVPLPVDNIVAMNNVTEDVVEGESDEDGIVV